MTLNCDMVIIQTHPNILRYGQGQNKVIWNKMTTPYGVKLLELKRIYKWKINVLFSFEQLSLCVFYFFVKLQLLTWFSGEIVQDKAKFNLPVSGRSGLVNHFLTLGWEWGRIKETKLRVNLEKLVSESLYSLLPHALIYK